MTKASDQNWKLIIGFFSVKDPIPIAAAKDWKMESQETIKINFKTSKKLIDLLTEV